MRSGARNQPFAQAAAASQAGFRPGHPAAVFGVVVVVAQKVKETMKGQNAQLGGVRMAALAGLARGDSGSDDDVAEEPRSADCFIGRRLERQDVGGRIHPAISAIELPDVPIGDEGDGQLAAQAGRRHADEPAGQSTIGDPPALAVGHRHDDAATAGIHRTIRTP
jgi:hypothetical protein